MSIALGQRIDAQQLWAWDREYVMGTYARQPALFVRGEGARLWDAEGREYLDFLSGIAVAGVGHANPRVAAAIAEQAGTLLHVSNLFGNPLQPVLAKRLCELSGMEKAFFCNSGAEANEAAIKLARKWAKMHRPGAHEIITLTGSFHGRTLATVTATAQPKYQEAFKPLPVGFKHVERGSLPALDAAIDERTCAVMIEPVQGESGIHVLSPEYLAAARALCDEAEILLILDEVQSGNGRSGRFLASQRAGVEGDVVTLAKGIASGVPMGVCLARGEAAATLVPGDHGSTFGGQPLACAAALATLDALELDGLMENAARMGAYFADGLRELQGELGRIGKSAIREVRGLGLLCAVDLEAPRARATALALLERGLVVNASGDYTLRFLPPLIVTESDCDEALAKLSDALAA